MLGSFRRAIFFLFSLPVSRWGDRSCCQDHGLGAAHQDWELRPPASSPTGAPSQLHNEPDCTPVPQGVERGLARAKGAMPYWAMVDPTKKLRERAYRLLGSYLYSAYNEW